MVDRIIATTLYDGIADTPFIDHVVDIADGRITTIRPAAAADARDRDALACDVLVPGFIDLQINGAADAQFNFDPTPETVARIAEGARAGGTTGCLPTFVTAPATEYRGAIEAVGAAIAAGVPGVLGLHLEGPFLSPDRPGIHPPEAVRPLRSSDLEVLCQPAFWPWLVTLAPEEQTEGTVAALVEAGRTVFAGHTEATAAQIGAAEAEGLSGLTHLFNAMSQMTGREPGAVGAALSSRRLFAGIIVDGHHVAWSNVQLAARLMLDRLCLVTDAMMTLAGTSTGFTLGAHEVCLGDGRLTNPAGRLAGAHVAMDECVGNAVNHCGVPLVSALRMASGNPASALGLGAELGRIAPGYRASMTLLDKSLTAVGTVVGGKARSC